MNTVRNPGFTRRATLAALCAVGLQCVVAPRARADAPEGGAAATANAPASIAWSSLTPEEQKVLDRFKDRWNTLAPEQQQKLLRGSRRWLSMTPEERDRVFGSKSRFYSSDAEREAARELAHDVGSMLEPRTPLGFGGLELAVAFDWACPNDTLPILRRRSADWIPLFERALG